MEIIISHELNICIGIDKQQYPAYVGSEVNGHLKVRLNKHDLDQQEKGPFSFAVPQLILAWIVKRYKDD